MATKFVEAEAIIIKNRTTIVICMLSNFPTISVGLVKILSISENFWFRKTSEPVTIKTDKKEIIISKPSVTEMKAQDNSIFTVTADSYEEMELEVPVFSDDDIQLVSQQAGVDEEKAKNALEEAKGDLARAILLLTSG